MQFEFLCLLEMFDLTLTIFFSKGVKEFLEQTFTITFRVKYTILIQQLMDGLSTFYYVSISNSCSG